MNTLIVPQPNTATASLPAWMEGIAGALPDAIAAAKVIIDSGFGPKDCKGPASIVVAVAMGRRLGLDPFTAIHGIAVVNGRPSLFGDALLAVCQNHPHYEDCIEQVSGEGEGIAATVTVHRKGRQPYSYTFTGKDAKHAGLLGKQGPWSAQPKRMCLMRARAFALRGAFADALAGFHAREELDDDEPRDVTATATVVPEPKPARRRSAQTAEQTASAAEQLAVEPNPGAERQGQVATEQPVQKQDAPSADPTTPMEAMVAQVKALWHNHGKPARDGLAAIVAEMGVAKLQDLASTQIADAQRLIDNLQSHLEESAGSAQ